ncbi:MAG: ABC transporter transmembrane domain-containing protein, partial [Pirellulaceae bacterium]|nr:ABC transporter transmembrane domain-containing protein [Pirellulaceae bacterium]
MAFFGLLAGFRATLVLALASLTVATLLKLVPPVGIKLVIDYVVDDQPIPVAWATHLPESKVALLFLIAGGIIALSIAATLVHLWGRWRATKIVNQVQVALRKRTFEHAVRLPLHRVYELKSGGAASLLREDAGGAAELIFSMIYNPWRAIIQLIGSLVVLALVDWRMMVAGIAMVPLVYVTHRTWVGRIRPMYRDVRKQRQDIDSHSTEAFGGMRVVRAFTRERSERGRFVLGNHLLVRQQLFVWWWARMIEVIWDLLIPVASTSLLVYGGYQIMQEQMTFGDLTMFLFYLAMLLEPLATLAGSATSFQNQLAGLDRVLDLLEEPNELSLDIDVNAIDVNQVTGTISFSAIGFRYPSSQQLVLTDVSLEVPAGTTCALVGRSGAGKTTLC